MKLFFHSINFRFPLKELVGIFGISIVVAVNAFVLLSDSSLFSSREFDLFHQMIHNANDQSRQINKSPFALDISFSISSNDRTVQPPLSGVVPFQIFFGIFAAVLSLIFVNVRRVCFIRGEEILATLFVRKILIPPPQRF